MGFTSLGKRNIDIRLFFPIFLFLEIKPKLFPTKMPTAARSFFFDFFLPFFYPYKYLENIYNGYNNPHILILCNQIHITAL